MYSKRFESKSSGLDYKFFDCQTYRDFTWFCLTDTRSPLGELADILPFPSVRAKRRAKKSSTSHSNQTERGDSWKQTCSWRMRPLSSKKRENSYCTVHWSYYDCCGWFRAKFVSWPFTETICSVHGSRDVDVDYRLRWP